MSCDHQVTSWCAHRVRVLSHWFCPGGGRYVPGSAKAGQLPTLGGGSGLDSDPLTGTGSTCLLVCVVCLHMSLLHDHLCQKGGSRYVPPMEQSSVSTSATSTGNCTSLSVSYLVCMCTLTQNQPKVTFTQGKSGEVPAGRSNSFYPVVRAPRTARVELSTVLL